MGDVCRPSRVFLDVKGVGRTSLSFSLFAVIFDNLDRRLIGDSRKAKLKNENVEKINDLSVCVFFWVDRKGTSTIQANTNINIQSKNHHRTHSLTDSEFIGKKRSNITTENKTICIKASTTLP